MPGASPPPSDGDFALLAAWQAGDRRAGERLMGLYYDRVLRFFELKAGFIAEDLTQQTFLACVRAKDTVRDAASFKSFVFSIARRQHVDHQRQAGRHEAAMKRAESWDGFATSVSVRVARRQEQKIVLQAMSRLPDDLLAAVQLYYWEDMPTREIADVLGVVPSTLTSRLARARELLREEVTKICPRPELADSIIGELEAWARSLAAIPLSESPAIRGLS